MSISVADAHGDDGMQEKDRYLTLQPDTAKAMAQQLIAATGVPDRTAELVASALVSADLQGKSSHGLLQLPVYLKRLKAGTIDPRGELETLQEGAAFAVCDAHCMLGHAAAPQAMALAIKKARLAGIAAVSVRRGTHFGVAGHYARQAAKDGLVGIAMANTRPMIAAPGGAEAIVGNNPLAIAIPTRSAPVVLDMAMSATSMGAIRMAAAAGAPIDPGLAVDDQGLPTTDAVAAISGMLAPAGGAKGFGLALVVDLLCGLLSGGAMGAEVASSYGPPDDPAECSWLFIAIDPSVFGDGSATTARAEAYVTAVERSSRVPGTGAAHVPGRRRQGARRQAQDQVPVSRLTITALKTLAAELGRSVPPAFADLD
ncbi:MAG: Ldh family oxidoreductase [Nitratireductor rhodophyticola]|uniref:Ldh family oxidoreductase n=1 Tax=Nitratireductor rhodophyticola TaxID=2854036 RepID=UPI0032D8F2D1